MAVLKQTSPTAWPVAPRPKPSSTVPSASTNSAVACGSSQLVCEALGCVSIGKGLNHAPRSVAPPQLREALAVLREDINNALKEAMKARQERRFSTLRLINAAILARETSGAERVSLNDADIVDVM